MAGDALLSARMDSQWIQIEGVARSLEQSDGYVTLHLVNGTTRLRLIGVCGSSSNARR